MCTGQNATTLHAMFSFSKSNRFMYTNCTQRTTHRWFELAVYKGEMRNETAKKK